MNGHVQGRTNNQLPSATRRGAGGSYYFVISQVGGKEASQ
jgi:hypothetical protein